MKKLTRTVAVLLMLVFVLGLGACAGTKDEPSTSVSPNDQESSATQSAAPESTAPESAAPESAAPESSGPPSRAPKAS